MVRTRHPVAGAPRPSGSQALLQASTGHMRCCTAQDRHRSITQLSGGKSRNPELMNGKHMFARQDCCARNNRSENRYRPTRERECRMRGSANQNARRHFSAASDRSGNTSHSSDICCVLRLTASNSPNASPHGIASPNSSRIRQPTEQTTVSSGFAPSINQRGNANERCPHIYEEII